jgi:sulfite reductase (NADPH) flavoprotein alpha-component
VVLTEDGLHALPLEELFRTWVRFVYLLVAMENALTADYGFSASVSTSGEDSRELTPFKAQYIIEAHRRFLVSYLDGLVQEDLRTLWQLTVGFCDPHLDIRSFDTDLAAISALSDVGLVRHSVAAVKALLLAGDGFGQVTALCRLYARVDVQLLRDLKTAVLEGIRAFEIHEADVVEQAGPTLLNALGETLAAASAYYQRLAKQTRGHGITADDVVEEPIPVDRGIPGHGGPLAFPD